MKEDVCEPVCGVVSAARQDRLAGPLRPFEAEIRAALDREGYTPSSVRYVIDEMRRLSCWMEQRGVVPGGLGPEGVAEFVADSSGMRTARRGPGTLLRLPRSQAAVHAFPVRVSSRPAAHRRAGGQLGSGARRRS